MDGPMQIEGVASAGDPGFEPLISSDPYLIFQVELWGQRFGFIDEAGRACKDGTRHQTQTFFSVFQCHH